MAFAGSTAPRRKINTYGKHSRRPTSNLNSATDIEFAQGFGAGELGFKGTTRHWQGDGRSSSPDLLQGRSENKVRSEALRRQALSSAAKPRVQNRSASGRSDPAKDDPLYDVPLSDNGGSRSINVARKRRRIMPSDLTAKKDSQVYDDNSLQKYIAAETEQDEGQTLHSPSPILNAQDPKSWRGAMNSQVGERHSHSTGMSETPKATPSRKDSTVDSKWTGNGAKASNQTRGILPARKQSKGSVGATLKHHRTHKTNGDPAETTTLPMTPDTLVDELCSQEASNGHRNSKTSRTSVDRPMTPPRPGKTAGGLTTPRQRELWSRLFVDIAQSGSPPSLDVPGLLLDVKQSKGSHGDVKHPKLSWEPFPKSVALKARPTKIVDTLHQSNQDQDQFCDVFDEIYGTAGNGNKSEPANFDFSSPDGAATVQISPSGDRQCVASQFQDHLHTPSQARPAVYEGSLKVTYARQRSYLTDIDLEETVMVDLQVPPNSNSRRVYERRRLRDQIPKVRSMQSFEEDEEPIDPQAGTMRSIHELREAGGNVRIVSELEDILDELGDHQPPCSASIKRSRLIDLVAKLEQPSNCRLFIDQGMESRLILDVGSSNDLITNGLLAAAFLQLMASSSRLGLTQVGNARVVRFLTDLLGSDQDILYCARLRENNMSKAAQADLKNLCSTLLDSTTWRVGKPSVLSCHVLSLQCLEYLERQTREVGSMSEVLSASAIERVVTTSVPLLSTKAPRPGEISVVCLELAVSILESCTINSAAECQASLWAGETLERIIGLLPLLALWERKECKTSRTLTLRLYLNLTNNSPSICEEFSTSEVISVLFDVVISHFEQLADSTLEIDRSLLLDDLILSLGSLINLADLSNMARQLIVDLHYENQSYLDILLQLFMNKSKNAAEVSSLEETSSNVALGWVSVLLGWLCVDPVIAMRVSGRLPGKNLKQLLDAIDEFLHYHRTVDQVIIRGDSEDDSKTSFVDRLQNHVDDLKKTESLSGTLYGVAGIGN